MATETNIKRQSMISVDSGVSVVSLDTESQDSLAVPDDASSVTSLNSTNLQSVPLMKGSLSLQSLGSCEGTDPMQVPPSLLTVWPRKCAFIVEEILQTENAYVMSLTETVKGYMNPLYYMEGVDQVDSVEGIFGNIQELHQLHDRFLLVLQSTATDRIRFAHSFKEYAKEFQEKYSVYCTQHPKAMQRLQKVMESKEAMVFFSKCQRSLGHALPLSSLLLKPVQRILRYKLLLEKLQEAAAKTLQDSQANAAIQDAWSEMASIADEINQRKKEYEILQDVQANLTGWNGGDLAQYGKLLLEDTLKVAGSRSERWVLLLEGLLLVVKRKESKYLYKHHINMDRMMVQDKGMNGEVNAIRVYEQHNMKDVTVLLFPSVQRKQEWLDILTQRILRSITSAKTTSKQRTGTSKSPKRRTKGGGYAIASPLSKSKRRKFSEEGKVSVAEFLMQMTESPRAARKKGGAWKKRGRQNKTKTLPNTASSRESTISPEGPRPRSDSWSPDFQLPTTASASFNPLLNLEDSFESSFEMSRTVEQHPGSTDVVPMASMPPSALETRLTVEDHELHLGNDDAYTNCIRASSPICHRHEPAASSGEATPTASTTTLFSISDTTTVTSDVDRVSTSSPPAHTQRNISYLEAVKAETDKEVEVEAGYLSSSSDNLFFNDSDIETTETDSDGELVVTYRKNPTRVPRSPLLRQKPLEKCHGTNVRRRYNSSNSSMQEGAEGNVIAAEKLPDETTSSAVEQESKHSHTASTVVQVGKASAEIVQMVGSPSDPNAKVPLQDPVMNDAEASNETASLSGLASDDLEQKGVEGSTVEGESGRSSEERNEVVSLEGPSPLRRQGSVKKLIANFEKAHANSEASTSWQRRGSNAGIQTSVESMCDASSSTEQFSPIPPPVQSERLDSKLSEPLVDSVNEGPKIRQPLWPGQSREFVSVKVMATQGKKQPKRKSSERSGGDASECSPDVQGSQDGGNAAVLTSPKKLKVSQGEVGHSTPPKSLQLEESLHPAVSEEATHQYSLQAQSSVSCSPSAHVTCPKDSRVELLEVQGCLEGLAESPLVDTRSHFLPVRQRAQDLNGRNGSVEMTTHRRESVQVMERQRQGSVSKISHFFEVLHEARVPSTEDTDGGNTLQEQQMDSCSPDMVGSELVTAAHQTGGQDIPCDDAAVDSSDKGLPEPVLALENGMEPSITCSGSVLGDDRHSTFYTDVSTEDNSNCSQGESSLKLTSAATSSSQSPSAGQATPSDCDSHHPTTPLSHDQVEDCVQVVMRDSPPPVPDHPADDSQPKAEGVDMKRLPSNHYTEDMHTTYTQEVEDRLHGDTSADCHLSWTEDLHESVSVTKPPQLSIETLIPTTPTPECTVVGVLSNEDQASYPPESVTDVPDTHSNSSVVTAADHDKEELELSVAASSDNIASDELLLHQLFTLTSNAQKSDIELSASKEDGMQVNGPDDDQEVISTQTSGIHEEGGEVKPDMSQTTETMTVNSLQTDDTQIAAHKANDVLSDEVECDAMSTAMIAVQRENMETSDVVMNDQQVDGNSTESPVTVQVQEPEIAQLSVASAHSMEEVTEEALRVYETTSVVGLPQKYRESCCVMYIEFDNVPPMAEASVSVTSEQVCENATVDTGSATDCADSKAVGQPPPLSDAIQSSLSLSMSQVDLQPVTWCSEQSQVTHLSTKTPPACTNAHSPPFQSGTPLPPVQITRQKEDNATKDEHQVNEDNINGSAPLNMNDCDREGVKTEPKNAVEQTMQETVLDRTCTAPDLMERSEDVENTQFVSHDYYTHAPTAKTAPDSHVQAVNETSATVSDQHLQQSPVICQSTLPSHGPAMVSGPPSDDFPTLNPSWPPTPLTSSYSSDSACLYNGDSQRWAQPGMWPSRQHDDRRQDQYLLQGHSYPMQGHSYPMQGHSYPMQGHSYPIQPPCPPLPYSPTMWNQGFSSSHYGHSGKRLPPHPHYQQHYRRHAQHGTAFGPSHHFEPPQKTIPAPFAADWTRSDYPEWGGLQYGRDAHLYGGQVQRPVLRPPSFSGSGGASPVLLKADRGQVEDGVGQYYRQALPLYEEGKQVSGGSGGGNSKSSSSHGLEWYTSSSEGEPTQAPTTGGAAQLGLHGDSTCEASLVDITQPCLPVWDDSGGLGGSRFELQASTNSVEVQTSQSTIAPSASPAVRYSDSLQMSSSTLNNGICQEGKMQWQAEGAGSCPSVDGGSGKAPADPSLQERAADTESAWKFCDEYFQRRSECPEVALQLETSVWDENGEENGMLLSLSPTTANQTLLTSAKMTPRRPTRHKSPAASGQQQIKRQGLYDTDSTSRLPLFHTPRGRGTTSWTKLLFILLFVFVIVFMGLQLFVGHVGWLPSL